MKIAGVTALHYGKDFLHHAIRSIIDDVDEYVVLYSSIGSHGHQTTVSCPETKDELYDIAYQAAGDKLHWFDGQWPYEGAQRDSIFGIVPDADVIVVLDSDEVWPPGLLRDAIAGTKDSGVRDVRLPFVHFYRSMTQAILHDPAYPVRLIYPQNKTGAMTFTPDSSLPILERSVLHFGYAQRSEIVRYKLETHGHKNEIRKDCDWFNDIFMNPLRTTDLHLVGSQFWNWETVDVPDFMQDHPYAKLSVIE